MLSEAVGCWAVLETGEGAERFGKLSWEIWDRVSGGVAEGAESLVGLEVLMVLSGFLIWFCFLGGGGELDLTSGKNGDFEEAFLFLFLDFLFSGTYNSSTSEEGMGTAARLTRVWQADWFSRSISWEVRIET